MKTYEYEFEKRAMLTIEQYNEIVLFLNRKYSPAELYIFLLNEYFDTDNLDLINSGIVLRVRHCLNKGVVLTLKSPLTNEDGDLETSQNLSIIEYNYLKDKSIIPNGPVKDKLISLNVPLHLIKFQTSLACKRTEIKDDEYVIVLDQNSYNDIVDFDIEVEGPSLEKANEKILEYSKMFNFEIKDLYLPKSKRALTSKKV